MEPELSHIDEYEGASLNYGELFIQESGQPMVFSMQICPKKQELTAIIQHHGGVLVAVVGGPHTIRLSAADNLTAVSASPCFRHQFILDCVQQQRLQQLADYRIDHGAQYSPIDLQQVLMGLKSWADVKPLPSLLKQVPMAEPLPAPVSPTSSFSSDDDKDCGIRQKFLKQRYFNKNRREYTHEDRATIVRYILDHGLLGQTGGRAMWQKMAHKQVVGNGRTWQSIKEHFRRQLVPHHLSQLGLTDHQKRMFLAKFPEAIKNYQDLLWPSKETQVNYQTSDPFESFNNQICPADRNLPSTSTGRPGTAAGARAGIDAASGRGSNSTPHNKINILIRNNALRNGGTLAEGLPSPISSRSTPCSSSKYPRGAYASGCSTAGAGHDFSDHDVCSEPCDRVEVWGDESEEETQQLSQSLLPQQTQRNTVVIYSSQVANAEVSAPNTTLGSRASGPIESLDIPESCSSLMIKAPLESNSNLQKKRAAVVNQSPSRAAESVLESNVVLLPGPTNKDDGPWRLDDQQQQHCGQWTIPVESRPARRRLLCCQRARGWPPADHLSQAPPAAAADQSTSAVPGRKTGVLLTEKTHEEGDHLQENTEELSVQLIKVVGCDMSSPKDAASSDYVLPSFTAISLSERDPPHGDTDSIKKNNLSRKHDDVSSKHARESSLFNEFPPSKRDTILLAHIAKKKDGVTSSQDKATPPPTPSNVCSQDYISSSEDVSSSQDSVVSRLPDAPALQQEVSSSEHGVPDKRISYNTEEIVPNSMDTVAKPLLCLTDCKEGVHPNSEWVADRRENAPNILDADSRESTPDILDADSRVSAPDILVADILDAGSRERALDIQDCSTSHKSSAQPSHQNESPRGRYDFSVEEKQDGDDIFYSDKMAAAAREGVGCSEDTSVATYGLSPSLVWEMSHQGSSDTEPVPDLNHLPIFEDCEERVLGGYLGNRFEYSSCCTEPLPENARTGCGGSDAGERESLSRAVEEEEQSNDSSSIHLDSGSQSDKTNKSGTSLSRSDESVSAVEEEESLLNTSKSATYPSTSPSSDTFTSNASEGVAAPLSSYVSRSRNKEVGNDRSCDLEGVEICGSDDGASLTESSGRGDSGAECTGLVNSFGARVVAKGRARLLGHATGAARVEAGKSSTVVLKNTSATTCSIIAVSYSLPAASPTKATDDNVDKASARQPQQTTSSNDDSEGEAAPSVRVTKRHKYDEARVDGEGHEDPPNPSCSLGSFAAQAAVSPATSDCGGRLSVALPPADRYSHLKLKELRVMLTPLPADGGVPFDEPDACSKMLDSNKLQLKKRYFRELCLVPKPCQPLVSPQIPLPPGEITLQVPAFVTLTGARSPVKRKSDALSSFESPEKRSPGSESSAKSIGSTRPTLSSDLLELPLKFPCQPSAQGTRKEMGAGRTTVIEEQSTTATVMAGADSGTNINNTGQGDCTTADEVDVDKVLEEEDEKEPSLGTRPLHRCILSGGRRAYTAEDRVAMAMYILDNGLADQTGGNAIWQRMARLKVVGGGHTWQSIKEHFRRQLVPHHLSQLALTDQQKRTLLSRFPEYLKKYNLDDSYGDSPTKSPPGRLIDQSNVISTSGTKGVSATPRLCLRRGRVIGRDSTSSSSDGDFVEEPQPNKRAKLHTRYHRTAATNSVTNRIQSPDKGDHLASPRDPSISHDDVNSRGCQRSFRESPRKVAGASSATVSVGKLQMQPDAAVSGCQEAGDFAAAHLSGPVDTQRCMNTSKPRARSGDLTTDSGELEPEPGNFRTNNSMRSSTDVPTAASTSGNDYKMLLRDWEDGNEPNAAGDEAQKGKRRWRSYSREEDMLILRFLLDTRRWREVGGRAVWMTMQSSVGGLRQRSWHSLKERYRKVLLPRLGSYSLTPDERARLRG